MSLSKKAMAVQREGERGGEGAGKALSGGGRAGNVAGPFLMSTEVTGARVPLTALAPMQDVTTLPFMRIVAAYGAPDYFYTEYLRVTDTSILEPHIMEAVESRPGGRPVVLQVIGENLQALARVAREAVRFEPEALDLNLGCPAPKVYRKNVGGGLLRDLPRVEAILRVLRDAWPGKLTVKTRIGFADDAPFEPLLELFARHGVQMLALHARTVKDLYRGPVRYAYIRKAAQALSCPVLGNGNITSAEKALAVLRETGCAGVMIGRSAIRNPWIFRQVRERAAGGAVFQPTLGDVRDYVERLLGAVSEPGILDRAHAGRLKKLVNFVALGVDPEGVFLQEMRRAPGTVELMAVCDRHMTGGKASLPFATEPHPGLLARPNCEDHADPASEFADTCG